jgi:hypothetical protein
MESWGHRGRGESAQRCPPSPVLALLSRNGLCRLDCLLPWSSLVQLGVITVDQAPASVGIISSVNPIGAAGARGCRDA